MRCQVVTDMFADQAYSLHAVALMAATIICVLSGAVLLALVGEKLYKRPLFWMVIAMFLFLTAFVVVRLVLLIAPTQIIYDVVRKLQTVAGAASAAAPLMILLALIIRKHSASLIFGMTVIAFLNVAGTAAVLQTEPVSTVDFYPAASFFAFCGFCLWSSKNLFPELSVVSPEAFLNEPHDLILVFDKRDRLMRASSNASEIFGVRENMTRDEFNDIFNEAATIQEDKSVLLAAESEIKYYQSSETVVKTRGGTELATVMMFSDVTEITKLKTQLSEKNDELNALNNQLEIALKTAEKLEAEQQKEKAILELEQAIGKKLENLTREIEAANTSQNLSKLIEACRDIMAGVRQSVSRLTQTEEGEQKDD
jgi:hypothetical protein